MNTKNEVWQGAEEMRIATVNKRKDEEHAAIVKHQQLILRVNHWRSCLNCINWMEKPMSGKTFYCLLYKAIPPPDVIVNGCRDWDDDIPF